MDPSGRPGGAKLSSHTLFPQQELSGSSAGLKPKTSGDGGGRVKGGSSRWVAASVELFNQRKILVFFCQLHMGWRGGFPEKRSTVWGLRWCNFPSSALAASCPSQFLPNLAPA